MVDTQFSPHEALTAAIATLGSQAALSRLIGLSRTAIWKWVQESQALPAEFVLAVEAATGVPRHHLRPDIYPPDLGPSPRWHGVDGVVPHVAFNRAPALQGGGLQASERSAA